MHSLSDHVKDLLDGLIGREEPPIITRVCRLRPSRMTEEDCGRVERELGIRLPLSYRKPLLAYDWSTLELGGLEFFSTAQKLVRCNQVAINPLYGFYQANHLLEIGYHEAGTLCIRLEDHNGFEGEVVYIDHAKAPRIEAEFVSSNFECFVMCAVVDLQLKLGAGYYEWSDSRKQLEEEALLSRIMDAILEVEPRANGSSFWYGFVRGF